MQPERLTAKTSTLATMLNLSSRRVSQLVQLKILPRPGAGGHDVVLAVSAYLDFLKQPTRAANLSEAKQKLIETQTAIKRLELEKRTGELVRRDAVEHEQFQLSRMIRDNFLNLPARTDALVAVESNQQKCFLILEKEVRQILQELTA